MAAELKNKPSFTPRRKWGVGFDVTVRTLVVVAVLVMLNHLASVFFHRQYLSTATKGELSSRTKNLLQSVTNEVKVTLYYDRDDRFYPEIAGLLREYWRLNPKIHIETVDYVRDVAEARRVKREYQLPETSRDEEKNYVIFECEGRKRQIPGNWLNDYVLQEVSNAKQIEYERKPTFFKGETAFTAALLNVTTAKPYKAYVLQGSGAHNIDSGDEVDGYLDFKALLQQNSVIVQPLVFTNGVPADCDLLVIPGPRSEIPKSELDKIEQYLDEGGLLFALFNAATTDRAAGLESILAKKWGVLVTDSVVTDPANAISQFKTDVRIGAFSEHPAVKNLLNFNLDLLSPRVVGAKKSRENEADVSEVKILFATQPTATLINNPNVPAQAFPLAVAVEKKAVAGVATGRGATRMIIVGDSSFLANGQMKLMSNRDFAGYALNWLLRRPQFTEGIGPKSFTEYRMTLTATQARTVRWLLIGAVPGGILLFGGLVWWRRQK